LAIVVGLLCWHHRNSHYEQKDSEWVHRVWAFYKDEINKPNDRLWVVLRSLPHNEPSSLLGNPDAQGNFNNA
jgi:hypothetical protein